MFSHTDGSAGMVAADEPQAALIGRDILSAGGNAADAAVAMSFALAVTLPSQAGLGAGGACLVYDQSKGTVQTLDFIAPPPRKTLPDTTRPTVLPALPGGLYALSARYGKLRWEALVTPAERLARQGMSLSRAAARQLAPAAGPLFEDAAARSIFAGANGQPLAEGDLMQQVALGATLSRLRTQGIGEFYRGPWADEIVAAVNGTGGSLTIDEMHGFLPQWKAPVAVPYGNDTAYFAPPPASGGVLEAELWAALARDGAYKAAGAEVKPHLLAEALSRGYVDRDRWLAAGNLGEGVAALTSKDHLKALFAGYSESSHQPVTAEASKDAGTGTGLVAMDGTGMAVACNISLNASFGIGRVAGQTGIIPAAAPSGPNGLGPMLAINTHSNALLYAAAAGGGPTAPSAMTEVALAALIDSRPLGEAVAAKRLHAAAAPDTVFVEQGFAGSAALQSRGHQLEETALPSRVNAVRCGGDTSRSNCSVATDPRGFGMATTVGN